MINNKGKRQELQKENFKNGNQKELKSGPN